MTPTSLFPDPPLADLHQPDLRAAAARARFARVATRGFALERVDPRAARRARLRPSMETWAA